MLRADKVIPAGHWTGAPADTVVLDFDGRYRRRVTMAGVGGLVFLLDLAEAAMLRSGDGLRLEDGRVVEVVAEAEPLAELRGPDALTLIRLAWHLGNRHLPTEMLAKALRIRRDPLIEGMAETLGARVIALEAPFNPEGGAYVQAEPGTEPRGNGHHHDHEASAEHGHGHDHHHDGGHAHHDPDHDHGACGHPDHQHDHGRRQ